MLKIIDSAVPVSCWSCAVSHTETKLFCPDCSKIQPPPGGNFFSVFGLEPKLHIDLAALETEFYKLSRKLHPDRYARATEQERDWSLADTAMLNDAYRTLKDPVRRTEYLLKLEGAEIGEEHAGKNRADAVDGLGTSRVPANLLEEVFELNMQLDEMRAARKAGASDPDLVASLGGEKKKFEGLLGDVDAELHSEWTAWDAGDSVVRAASQKKMVALLDRRKYLSNLLRDVNETLGA